ncbi:MAG: hypothetical protein JWN60_2777 [Acidobacteria bacterium]|nr:hypothetical protein [Acidobacteriota bacterium]
MEREMIKNISKYTFLLVILALTQTTFADVKIKVRQTISGQNYEGTTFIKGKRQRSERNIGGMQTVSLTQCDLRRSVQMNPQTKTFMINLFDGGEPAPKNAATASAKTDKVVRSGGTITTTYTIKDTGERRQMFGYAAKHLIITMESVSSPDACTPFSSKMMTDGWYIDAEFALDCDLNYGYRGYNAEKSGGCQDRYVSKQIGTAKRGYPVYEKMTMYDKDGKESYSMINEVIELSKVTLDQALFEVPSDYREAENASGMYNVARTGAGIDMPDSGGAANSSYAGANSGIKLPAKSQPETSSAVGAKQPGAIRIGVSIKTGPVGDAIPAAELSAAVQNTLGEYLKGTKIELVSLEAKLAGSIDSEAKTKECDYVLYVTVSHKKGGGGGLGGMFGSVIAPAIGSVGLGNTGSVAGNIAAQAAANAIITAGTVAANVKSKDEITLDVKLDQAIGVGVFAKQYKNKAKSNGQDIISPLVEQMAQTVVESAK